MNAFTSASMAQIIQISLVCCTVAAPCFGDTGLVFDADGERVLVSAVVLDAISLLALPGNGGLGASPSCSSLRIFRTRSATSFHTLLRCALLIVSSGLDGGLTGRNSARSEFSNGQNLRITHRRITPSSFAALSSFGSSRLAMSS